VSIHSSIRANFCPVKNPTPIPRLLGDVDDSSELWFGKNSLDAAVLGFPRLPYPVDILL
jgi:hypothetical protein